MFFFESECESVSCGETGKRGFERGWFSVLGRRKSLAVRAGKNYYVTRNESSLLAFSMPKEKPLYYHLCASHSDFPTFRIKKVKKKDAFYAKAEIEGYGGMIHTSWFDRPLGLAGRVIKKTKEGIFSVLIAPDKNVFVIPNLSIILTGKSIRDISIMFTLIYSRYMVAARQN